MENIINEIPKKKENPPTPEQKAAIESLKNTVVAAGAGSGKTFVLAKRFLNLVQNQHYNVEEILTLTFTKKATVEMSDRIYKVLKDNEPEQAANFYKANIKTIDSYCNSVAKLGCRFYGISPDFTLDDNALRQNVIEKALPFVLSNRDNPVIKYFVEIQNYEQMAEDLFVNPIFYNSTVAEPIDFVADLEKQYEFISEEWNKKLKAVDLILDFFDELEDRFDGNTKTKFFEKYLEIKNSCKRPEDVYLTADDVKNGKSDGLVQYILALSEFNYAKPGNTKFTDRDEFNDSIVFFRNLISEMAQICNYVDGAPFARQLVPLLEEFQEIVMELKRSSKTLTYHDVSNMALNILKDYPEIRRLEKNKYKAIMIDEFQDNNSDQRDLLFLLSENYERMEKSVPSVDELLTDKLFFVGDEKQSIYKFRGADVQVFNNLRKDFAGGNLPMTINHRSHPSLIAAFNTIFGGYPFPNKNGKTEGDLGLSVFYKERDEIKEPDSIPRYEAVYHEVKIPDYKKDKSSSEKLVHVALYDYEENKDSDENKNLIKEEAEAEWVARKIEEKIAQGVAPNEIAVLMKSYAHASKFEKAFLRHGIPYNNESVTGIFDDGPVCDITAYLRLIVYKDDTFSYGQVLRSPFVNMSIVETEAILSLRKDPFDEAAFSVLQGNSLERFKNAKDFFEGIQEAAQKLTLSKLVTKLWYEGGYRFETMWNKTVKMYEKLYDLMFEFARQSDEGNLDLSSFIDALEKYKGDRLDDFQIPVEKAEGVHIMSVHKSKGLEFDVVFVCNTNNGGKDDNDNNPIYKSQKFGLVIKTPPCKGLEEKLDKENYFFKIAKEENLNMASAELRRLTYVALTRAKNELFITNGNYKVPKKEDKSYQYLPGEGGIAKSIYNSLEAIINYYQEDANFERSPFTKIEWIKPYMRDEDETNVGRTNKFEEKLAFAQKLREIQPYESAKIIKKEEVAQKYVYPSKFDDVGTEIQANKIEEKFEDEYYELNEIHQKYPNFKWSDFGTIAHSYMEAGINGIDLSDGSFPFKNKDIVGLQGSKKALEKVIAACLKMKEKFEKSEIGIAAKNAKWKRAEYLFKSRVAEKLVFGVIDLVFEQENGEFVIVDYKTNQAIEPEVYYGQLACYRQAISKMMNVDASKIKVWLYYLRFNKALDITDQTDKIDIEDAIKKL